MLCCVEPFVVRRARPTGIGGLPLKQGHGIDLATDHEGLFHEESTLGPLRPRPWDWPIAIGEWRVHLAYRNLGA